MPRNGGGKNTRKQTKINVSTTTASTNVLLCLYCSLAVALLLPCCCLAVALLLPCCCLAITHAILDHAFATSATTLSGF